MDSPDPLYNALIYVPAGPVPPFPHQLSCDQCQSGASLGSPIVTGHSAPDGTFTLTDAPSGQNVPLVVQLGRWRRQVTIPNVVPCTKNVLPDELTRMPRNKTEGDLPHIAMVTGSADAHECVLLKMGIDASEFTNPDGNGAVHIFQSNGATIDTNTPGLANLFDSVDHLKQYDMVLLACESSPLDHSLMAPMLVEYANAGGRVFATHYSYAWLWKTPPFDGVATWSGDGTFISALNLFPIDQTTQKGKDFASWLLAAKATTIAGVVGALDAHVNVTAVKPPTQQWITFTDPTTNEFSVQHLSFNTPVGAAAAQQCGRVIFSGFHVTPAGGETFPAECSVPTLDGGTTLLPLESAEKVLEFMLYDLASCIVPDKPPPPPTCTPTTCAAQGIGCGMAGDGCGGQLNCGACPAGQVCGGGGVPYQCGQSTPCKPLTCAGQGISCGPAGDGCGGELQCGACTTPNTCGGGGVPGQCGAPPPKACVPLTCQALHFACGPAEDGCGHAIQCGGCPAGQVCGGGGVPGQCGGPSCSPKNCAVQGVQCGPAGDGCGHAIDCGSCPAPLKCGGGGVPGVCGEPKPPACVPKTCAQIGYVCGAAGDGCGGTLDCGKCASGQICGGGGVPGQCGGPKCKAKTCAQLGLQCGPGGDGCGNVLDCGTCPDPLRCGGAGVHGVCGMPEAGACVPRSCAEADYECGTAADGCGGLVECGTCPKGDLCGGGGIPGRCGGPRCTPTTCEALKLACGAAADGCGHLLQCGECPDGWSCDEGKCLSPPK
jgi:hypothetical protein